VPTASGVVVVNCATPDTTLPVPITAPLSLNVTMPVAVEGTSVAVKVSFVPALRLVDCACKLTVGVTAVTVTITVVEVAAVSFPSPP
jgi:hypothetical protein